MKIQKGVSLGKVLLLVLMSLSVGVVGADTIELKSGEVIEGIIQEENDRQIKIKVKYGVIDVEKDQITSLTYDQARPDILAGLAYAKGLYQNALDLYQQVLDQKTDDPIILAKMTLNKAQCLFRLERYLDAITALDEFIEDQSDSLLISDMLYLKRKCHLALGEDRKVQEILKTLQDKHPQSQVLKTIELEISLQKLQNKFHEITSMKWHYKNLPLYDEVILGAKTIVFQNPENPAALEAQALIIDSYEKQAEYGKALKAAQKYLSIYFQYHYELGSSLNLLLFSNTYFNKARYDIASVFYERLFRSKALPERNDGIAYRIAKGAEEDEKYNQARKWYEHLTRNAHNPLYRDQAFLDLAQILIQTNRAEESKTLLQDFSKKYPQSSLAPKALVLLSFIEMGEKNYAVAKDNLERLTKDYPNSIELPLANRLMAELENKLEEKQ